MIKAIIFDFDGVIADSVNIKTEAFATLYENYGDEIVEKVKTHHIMNGGISRYEKIRYYHSNFLDIELSEKKIEELAEKFSGYVYQKVVESPFMPGAFEFILNNFNKYDLFISSGIPEKEIREIAGAKGISEYFIEIFGSPESKSNHIKFIMNERELKSSEIIFIGDSFVDRSAAVENKIKFIAVGNGENNCFSGEKYRINDPRELEIILEGINV